MPLFKNLLSVVSTLSMRINYTCKLREYSLKRMFQYLEATAKKNLVLAPIVIHAKAGTSLSK